MRAISIGGAVVCGAMIKFRIVARIKMIMNPIRRSWRSDAIRRLIGSLMGKSLNHERTREVNGVSIIAFRNASRVNSITRLLGSGYQKISAKFYLTTLHAAGNTSAAAINLMASPIRNGMNPAARALLRFPSTTASQATPQI